MAARPHGGHFRAFLRASTTTLRTSQLPTQSSQFSSLTLNSPQFSRRSRSPSPPPPYTPNALSRNVAPPPPPYTPWSRFTTPYSYSSVRTFTSTRRRPFTPSPPQSRPSSPSPSSSADAASQIEPIIEQITDLYGTARDEFEIASEETEKNTTYAADDRAAARDELDKLLEFYRGVLGGDAGVAEEVKRRVGGRIRELEQAVLAMEESVTHGD